MTTMTHDGYVASIELDEAAGVFHGEVINTRDVLTFQGRTLEEQSMLPFRERGDRLIHDAAAYPHVIAFRAKGDARNLPRRQRRACQRDECLRGGDRQRGR